MPKEFRKRGKKKRAAPAEEPAPVHEEEAEAGPSWIVSGGGGGADGEPAVDPAAPFGYVDADVKAYFRTVDAQLREWQDLRAEAEDDDGGDPNENRRAFLMAALAEMRGREKALASDADCATVLERMAHSMDDFVRRVFADSLSGSFEILARHRFASHVVQTLLEVLRDTIDRENRGVLPKLDPADADAGELRTARALVLDLAAELLPALPALILDPFGAHVLRALLGTLRPALAPAAERSKKSAAWKAKQGAFRSVFTDDGEQGQGGLGKGKARQRTESEGFEEMARTIVERVCADMDANEVRSLAANKASSPALQMLVRLEAELGLSDAPDSIMDRVTAGLVTHQHASPDTPPEASDYLGTLLRDATASHLLETLLASAPPATFALLWSTYLEPTLARLAAHPVANFVVAAALARVDAAQLRAAVVALREGWKKIRSARSGVLRAIVERAAALGDAGDAAEQAVLEAFEIRSDADRALLVPCVLRLQTPAEYAAAAEPTVAGALLLQALLRLPAPHHDAVLSSLHALPVPDLIAVAQHPAASRVLDALLSSPALPPKARRTFLTHVAPHLPAVADDRVGSRVAERLWGAADGYTKEKLARGWSREGVEQRLSASFYGKWFARAVDLGGFVRGVDGWRERQVKRAEEAKRAAEAEAGVPAAPTAAPSAAPAAEKENGAPAEEKGEGRKAKKRKRAEGAAQADEIDALFDGALGRKVKRAALDSAPDAKAVEEEERREKKRHKKKRKGDGEDGLEGVLGAIREAPKGGEKKGRR